MKINANIYTYYLYIDIKFLLYSWMKTTTKLSGIKLIDTKIIIRYNVIIKILTTNWNIWKFFYEINIIN